MTDRATSAMIRNGIRFLLKDTAIYGIAGGTSRFLMLLALPIVAKNLPAEEFGVWAVLVITGNVVSAFLMFGMDSAVVRYYYDDDSDQYRRKVFSNGAIFQTALSAVTIVLLVMAASVVLTLIGLGSDWRRALWVVLATAPGMVLVQFAQNWFKWTFQRARFLAMAIGLAGFTLAALYYVVEVRGLGLMGVLVSMGAAQWAFALLGLWWCRRYFRARVNRELLVDMLRFGSPMMLVALAAVFLTSLDRLFLTRYVSSADFGVYAFGQRLSVLMVMAVTAFQTAFGPYSFANWNRPEAAHAFGRYQTYYIAAAGCVALLICSFGRVLVLLLGSREYVGAEQVLPLLVFGSLMYGLYSFASIGIFYAKRSGLSLAALAGGLAAATVANLALAPFLEGVGVAAGFAIGNSVLVGVSYLLSRRLYAIEFRVGRDLLLLGVLGTLLVATSLTLADALLIDAMLKAGLAMAILLAAALALGPACDRAAVMARVRAVFSHNAKIVV